MQLASGCMWIWFADSIPALVGFLRALWFPPTPKNRTPSHKILFRISGYSLWGCVCGCLMPGGATYIPLHVVITDQTLSFFTQNTDMPKDWKVTLTTDLLWKKDTHIADHSPGANKDTQITDLKSHNPFHWWQKALGEKLPVCTQTGNSIHSATHSKFTLNKTLTSLSTVLSVRSTVAGPVRIYYTSVDC